MVRGDETGWDVRVDDGVAVVTAAWNLKGFVPVGVGSPDSGAGVVESPDWRPEQPVRITPLVVATDASILRLFRQVVEGSFIHPGPHSEH